MAYDSKFQSRTPNDAMPDSYYQKGVDGFLGQMGLSLHSAANWRFFALSMLCVNIVAVGMVGYLAVRSTIVPYIVEVDNSTGAVISSSKILARAEADNKLFEHFIWQVIRKTRTLPKDMVLYERNWDEAYTFFTSETSQKINDMATREKHQQKLKDGNTTMLKLKSITPLAGQDNTFNVRWNEVTYDNKGKSISEYELEGYFKVEQSALDEKTVYSNPLGIKIIDFTISQGQK